MKQLLLLLITISAISTMAAQSNLRNISKFFEKPICDNENVTIVDIKSEKLKSQKIALFRSITIENDDKLVQQLEKAINEDTQNATNREVSKKSGRIAKGIYTFKSLQKDLYKYILYKNNIERNKTKAIMVYIEGSATLEELEKIFQ